MNRRILKTLTFILLLAALPLSAGASSLYCGNQLIKPGDLSYQVARECPEPFFIERWNYADPYGYHHLHGGYEAWLINFGPRKLIRRLVFFNGYLQRVQELEHGVPFEPGSRRCSAQDLENVGTSMGEVFANCGSPDFEYHSQPFLYHSPFVAGTPGFIVNETRWIYTFGRRAADRELIFRDGRLQRINKLRR